MVVGCKNGGSDLREEICEMYENKDKKIICFYKGKRGNEEIVKKIHYYSQSDGGGIKYEENYKDGKEDGLYRSWYENGQLRYKGERKDGLPYGLSKVWFENGQLMSEMYCKGAYFIGTIREWYENGQLKSKKFFGDGKSGLISEKCWDEQGNKIVCP